MRRTLLAFIVVVFFSPLFMMGAFVTMGQQSDPAFASGIRRVDAQSLLQNPRVSLTPNARADLAAGLVDDRLVSLVAWISERHTITVGVFKTGHHKYVRGTERISNHYFGRAVDILIVDGLPVSAANPYALQVVLALASLDGALRPGEVGHPFGSISFPGGFTDPDHQSHIHIGYR